ncbi:hypothetical protein B6U98_03205 [Thermoplasmatales archaeon ex4572_165]|nr:MAG: hypothetical protein B6U98_03205 [Thermoplasmatales archaeon ex4572_165]RLF58549.1 MAG: hypothetical protein DRN27_05120 [Thermoplasmata archaeon]
MKRSISLTILFIFLSTILIQPSIISDDIDAKPIGNEGLIYGENGGVRLNQNKVSLLYINGTFYEMGFQLGSLMKNEFLINYRAFTSYYEKQGFGKSELIQLWKKQESFITNEVKDYIQGTADALSIPFDDFACIWVAEGAAYTHRCSSFSAWGDATYSGGLIHARSLEFPLSIEDPITRSYVQDYPIIIIADPDDYYAFTYPSFAGYVVEDGMNEQGIAISNMWSENNDQTDIGEPMGIRIFEALYSASTIDDAIDILTSDKTYGYNFIISDAKVPVGYAVETTANKYYAGTWDDPVEQIKPFWAIKDVVRRSNCFLDPDLAKEQRDIYKPNQLNCYLRLLLNGEPWAAVWLHYKALSIGLEDSWGKIDLINSITLIRSVYHGQYDPLWKLILSFREDWKTWWQWVAEPETGVFSISFADGETSAHWTPILTFDLLESLKRQAPTLT